MKGQTASIDKEENECFFGSAEEIQGLYDALAEGDEGVKSYVASREAEREYLDDLPLVDSAAKARYLLLDILDLPIAVFPEENIIATYYTRTVIGSSGGYEHTNFSVLYKQNSDNHFQMGKYIEVSVLYHTNKENLKGYGSNGATPVETLERNGYEVGIYVREATRDDTPGAEDSETKRKFEVAGRFLSDAAAVEVRFPRTENVKETVARLEKLRITTLRKILKIGNEE